MAPVITALRSTDWCDCIVLATGQHRELLDQVLSIFDIRPDADLRVMQQGQTLAALTARLITGLDAEFERLAPAAVLAQGDTTSVLAAAMAAFYRRLPFGHVEAGLRTHDMDHPFPEEMNRVLVGPLARWHFAPTQTAVNHLLAEGGDAGRIHLTGNTVIDALLSVVEKADASFQWARQGRRLVLVTTHRRENFGAPLERICRAIAILAARYPDVDFLVPVHPNPSVKTTLEPVLCAFANIRLCEPLDYLQFVAAMQQACVVLTDSGGVQEEAPALAKPVLVMRERTERPEAVEAGVAKLVGTRDDVIVSEVCSLLDDPLAYAQMARGVSPYGDGRAAERIASVLTGAFTTVGA